MNQSVIQLRKLLSGNFVVALDTNVLIDLEKENEPVWFMNFVKMREAGVRFSIPDLCVGERLNRFEHAEAKCFKNMKEGWCRMVSHLDEIIWHDLPCLPLRGDLYDLVGIQERGKERVRVKPFSVERAKELYRFLCGYVNSPYNRKEQRHFCIEEFKNVRRGWKTWILDWRERSSGKSVKEMYDDHMSELKSIFTSPVEILTLFELPVRFAAECAHDSRYLPTDDDDCCHQGGKVKPSNDGLDYAILFLTMASINICSFDRLFKRVGCMKRIHRSCCCHKPGAIYDEWNSGKLPYVVLPQVTDDPD